MARKPLHFRWWSRNMNVDISRRPFYKSRSPGRMSGYASIPVFKNDFLLMMIAHLPNTIPTLHLNHPFSAACNLFTILFTVTDVSTVGTGETTRSTLTDSRLFCDVIHRDDYGHERTTPRSRKPLL
ncbi:hypothetical protein TNCV_4153101 [Trichonephila clavipes]|nr:hypothetical protein TNCV_4153101 [Trichonephila clavipes]